MIKILMLGVIIPAFISFFISGIVWKIWGKELEPIKKGFWSNSLGFTMAYIFGNWGLVGFPPLPPVEATQWMIFIAGISLIAGFADSFFKLPLWINLFIRLLSTGGVLWVLLTPMFKFTWTPEQSRIYFIILLISGILYWFLFEKLNEKQETGITIPLIYVLVATGTSFISLISNSALIAQMAGIVAASSGSLFLISIIKPSFSMKGSVPFFVLILIALWVNIYFYVGVSALHLLLIIISPLLAFICELKQIKNLKKWQIHILRIIIILIPIVVSLGLTYSAQPAESQNYDY